MFTIVLGIAGGYIGSFFGIGSVSCSSLGTDALPQAGSLRSQQRRPAHPNRSPRHTLEPDEVEPGIPDACGPRADPVGLVEDRRKLVARTRSSSWTARTRGSPFVEPQIESVGDRDPALADATFERHQGKRNLGRRHGVEFDGVSRTAPDRCEFEAAAVLDHQKAGPCPQADARVVSQGPEQPRRGLWLVHVLRNPPKGLAALQSGAVVTGPRARRGLAPGVRRNRTRRWRGTPALAQGSRGMQPSSRVSSSLSLQVRRAAISSVTRASAGASTGGGAANS